MTVDQVERFEVVDPDAVKHLADAERQPQPEPSFVDLVWAAIVPETNAEVVMDLGLVLLAIGLAMVAPPLALIVPGAVLVIVALGFTFVRRET